MLKKDEKFDAVWVMRWIWNESSRWYIEDPSAKGRDLQEIKKGWGEWVGMVKNASDDETHSLVPRCVSDALMTLCDVTTIGFGGRCKR